MLDLIKVGLESLKRASVQTSTLLTLFLRMSVNMVSGITIPRAKVADSDDVR